MRVCDAGADCKRPGEAVSERGLRHDFAGYGWYCKFHPECCPGEMDGTTCDKSHPPGWTPLWKEKT